jgi:hypothetical protein
LRRRRKELGRSAAINYVAYVSHEPHAVFDLSVFPEDWPLLRRQDFAPHRLDDKQDMEKI